MRRWLTAPAGHALPVPMPLVSALRNRKRPHRLARHLPGPRADDGEPSHRDGLLSEPSVPSSIEDNQTAQDHQSTAKSCWFVGQMQEAAADVPERSAAQTHRHFALALGQWDSEKTRGRP